jgi:hypothetical protein
MDLKRLFGVWCKYQLSLNWLNILFRYSVKLLLLLNLIIIVVGTTYKFKFAISQFPFLIAGLVLTDLILKFNLQKKRQDLQAFHVIPNGVVFLQIVNIIQDIFSPRNLILPLLTTAVVAILGQQTSPPLVYLFVVSCMSNMVAGFLNKRKNIIAILTAIELILATLCFHFSLLLTITFSTLVFLLLIYLRYAEKIHPEENILNPNSINSIYSIGNRFLWLDLQILKKSRHLQLTLMKVFAICLLYCYIISTRYTEQVEIGFDVILLIQVYYSLTPLLLIPYILSSNYSYIGLLVTLPDMKSFFLTKLNIILLIQFLLTLVLYGLNYRNVQALFLISSICIFNILIITPILFMGILLTDEKVNVFDSSINNLFFIPSFVQSMYFLGVLIGTAIILYFLRSIDLNIFSWALTGLSALAFFQKERFFQFFNSQYNRKKYKLFNILS